MKTKSLLFSLMLLAGVIGFSSCQDDEVAPLTKQEAEQEIANSEAQVATINAEVANSEGFKAQNVLYEIGLPFNNVYISKSNYANDSYNELRSKFKGLTKELSGDFEFDFEYLTDLDFESNVGTWTYTVDGWQHTSTPSNQIVILFPYPLTNTSNNAKLTYYDYTTKLVYGEKYPTGLKCKLEVENQQVFSFVYSISIESLLDQSSIITVNFGKFTVISEASFDLSSASKISMSGAFTLKKDGAIVYKNSSSILGTPKGDNDWHYVISAKLRFLTLEFRMKIEADKSQMDSENFDIFQALEMSLYTTDGAKVGDFKFVIENQQPVLYFVYTDGTQVQAYTVFEKLGYILENFWNEIIDDSSSDIK